MTAVGTDNTHATARTWKPFAPNTLPLSGDMWSESNERGQVERPTALALSSAALSAALIEPEPLGLTEIRMSGSEMRVARHERAFGSPKARR